jgi:hypothetical protein
MLVAFTLQQMPNAIKISVKFQIANIEIDFFRVLASTWKS